MKKEADFVIQSAHDFEYIQVGVETSWLMCLEVELSAFEMRGWCSYGL